MTRASAPSWTRTVTAVLECSVARRKKPNKRVPAKKATSVQSNVVLRPTTADATAGVRSALDRDERSSEIPRQRPLPHAQREGGEVGEQEQERGRRRRAGAAP